jgi:SPP1 gp7 family putative phage head morphogenesis protein
MREKWLRVRRAEGQYVRQLIGVARQIGLIVRGFAPGGRVENIEGLTNTLSMYEEVLEPWAREVAGQMLEDVNRRDARAWHEMGVELGVSLREQVAQAPIATKLNEMLEAQVAEIKSLPRFAAQRVYERAAEIHVSGRRSAELAQEIMATGHVTAGRAKMIAKSAVSTASTNLVEVRARNVGSETYTWHTSENEDVREDHRILNGKTFRWDSPPIVDRRSGYRSHPGCNANCQCWAEPHFPGIE